MTRRALFAIFLGLHFASEVAAQSYSDVTHWFYSDLSKLEEPCLNVWARFIGKKQQLSKDSTLAYCLCYDKAARRLDAAHWNIMRTRKGDRDTTRMMELHHEFDPAGGKIFDVQRESWRLRQAGDSAMSTWVKRLDRVPDGRPTREISVILNTTLIHQGGQVIRWTDSTNWRIDSMVYNGKKHLRTVSNPHGDLLRDSTVYLHARDSSWSRQVEFSGAFPVRSTTIMHHAGHPILQVDSMFFKSGQQRSGIRVSETRSSYEDTLLVEWEQTDWYKAYDLPRNWLAGDDPGPPVLKSPPVRQHYRNVYEDGKLLRSVWYTEKGHQLDTTVYRPVDGYMLRDGQSAPVLSRLPNGLPLVTVDRDSSRRLTFEYTEKWPARLPSGRDLDPLKTWEPKR